MCEIHFYYYQESLNRFRFLLVFLSFSPFHPPPPPSINPQSFPGWLLCGMGKFFSNFLPTIITYFPNEIALWFFSSAVAVWYYWFLNEIFLHSCRNFYQRYFLLSWKVTTVFEKFRYFSLSSVMAIRICLSYNLKCSFHIVRRAIRESAKLCNNIMIGTQ